MYGAKKILCLFCVVLTMLSHAMDTLKTSHFNSIDTVSQECMAILAKLEAQPLFDIEMGFKRRILPLDNSDKCRIVGLLCNATKVRLTERACWNVSGFSDLSGYRDDYGLVINCGISEFISKEWEATRFPPQRFKAELDQIIGDIQVGWKCSTLEQYPNYVCSARGKKSVVFVKQHIYPAEDTLIYCLARSLGLKDSEIQCSSQERMTFGADRTLIMLWLNKKKLSKIIQILGLKIDELPIVEQ